MIDQEAINAGAVGSPGEPQAEGGGGSSVLDRLRAFRSEMEQDKSIDLDVPGYRGTLVARMRPLTLSESESVRRRVQKMGDPQKSYTAEMKISAAIIEAACLEVFARYEDELHPLANGGDPVRFDERLAEMLNLPPARGEWAVMNILAVEKNPQYLRDFAESYNEWLTSENEEMEESVQGESTPTR